MAILIGHAVSLFRRKVGVHYLTNENDLCAHIHLSGGSRFQIGDGAVKYHWSATLAYLVVDPIKFVCIPSGLKTKATNKGE